MKIAIDIRPLLEEKHTGVQEYLTGLLGQFLKLDRKNEYIFFYSVQKKIKNQKSKIKNIIQSMSSRTIEDSKIKHIQIPNKFLNISLKFFNRPYLDKLVGGVDVFFTPNMNFVPVSKNCRKVITFHDLSFERHPDFFSLKRRLWHKFINPKKQAKTANAIIAVSQSTKDDLVELYKIQPEKIKVIYSGINKQSQKPKAESRNYKSKIKSIQNKYHLPEKFILYLGTIEPRKNIVGLIKAFELLKSNFPKNLPNPLYKKGNNKYKLVIAGPKGWLYKDVFDSMRKSKYKKDIIFTGFIDQKDKQYFYELAELFVYPSFYEGFGFPPLEAMAQGAPAITSNISSLPEAIGDAAIMIDPYNINEIAQAMEMVLTDEALREKLKEKGIKQVEKFSWQKCARETLEILTD